MRTKKTAPPSPSTKLGSRIAARIAKRGLTKPLPELRGQAPRIPSFVPSKG